MKSYLTQSKNYYLIIRYSTSVYKDCEIINHATCISADTELWNKNYQTERPVLSNIN